MVTPVIWHGAVGQAVLSLRASGLQDAFERVLSEGLRALARGRSGGA
jgi:hypothetical protein